MEVTDFSVSGVIAYHSSSMTSLHFLSSVQNDGRTPCYQIKINRRIHVSYHLDASRSTHSGHRRQYF